MNCERIAELLPDYLQGSLGHDVDDQVEAHFEQCAACKELVRLWNEMGMLPEEQPTPALRARFEEMMAAYQAGRKGGTPAPATGISGWRAWLGSGWSQAVPAVALGLLLLVVGFAAGRYGMTRPQQENGGNNEIAALRGELVVMRQLLGLTLLQLPSASQRLEGVSYTMQKGTLDPRVLDALLNTLRHDASVDVRIAALRALSNYRDEPVVRTGLVDSLQRHQSPLVQVELINLLVELRAANARQQLQQMQDDKALNPVVRDRAGWALTRLN